MDGQQKKHDLFNAIAIIDGINVGLSSFFGFGFYTTTSFFEIIYLPTLAKLIIDAIIYIALKKEHRLFKTIIMIISVINSIGVILAVILCFEAQETRLNAGRDTQRKNNYSLIATAVENYQSNHNGKLPKEWSDIKRYVNEEDWADPQGGNLNITIKTLTNNLTTETLNSDTLNPTQSVYIYTSATCDRVIDGKVNKSDYTRSYAIVGYLESGIYCADNE